MSISTATVNPVNMELTPMRVTYNGVDLGGTLSNVAVHVKYSKSAIKADQFGSTTLDQRVSGQEMTVTCDLAEINLKDNWKVVFPHSHLISSGGNKQEYFDMQIGDGDLSNAKVLVLHPLSRSNADLAGDFKFFLATASATSDVTYSPTGQAKLKVVFHIYPDTGTIPARWMVYGDPAIGVVAATATQAYAGTGNGVLSALTAYSGFTKTESITVTCVGAAANGGKFFVTGSVSGALGLVTLPGTPGGSVGFTTPGSQVSFTLADGGVDFIVGDVFTLTATAANYA